MSNLVTIDTLNTTNNLESTRNALKTLNARNTQYKNIDRNCDVLSIEYDLLIVMFVNINITITINFFNQ